MGLHEQRLVTTAGDQSVGRLVSRLDARLGSRVVEPRDDLTLDAKRSRCTPEPTVDRRLKRRFGALGGNRHKIGEHGSTRVGLERGLEDVGTVEIRLLRVVAVSRANGEMAATVGIEQSAEHARRGDVRETAPINRAVATHKRAPIVVADKSVLGERGVSHRRRWLLQRSRRLQ